MTDTPPQQRAHQLLDRTQRPSTIHENRDPSPRRKDSQRSEGRPGPGEPRATQKKKVSHEACLCVVVVLLVRRINVLPYVL